MEFVIQISALHQNGMDGSSGFLQLLSVKNQNASQLCSCNSLPPLCKWKLQKYHLNFYFLFTELKKTPNKTTNKHQTKPNKTMLLPPGRSGKQDQVSLFSQINNLVSGSNDCCCLSPLQQSLLILGAIKISPVRLNKELKNESCQAGTLASSSKVIAGYWGMFSRSWSCWNSPAKPGDVVLLNQHPPTQAGKKIKNGKWWKYNSLICQSARETLNWAAD